MQPSDFRIRTIQRAKTAGLAVTSSGPAVVAGHRFFAVASQSSEIPHEVILDAELGQVVSCDCNSFEHRGFCIHAATVQLSAERPAAAPKVTVVRPPATPAKRIPLL